MGCSWLVHPLPLRERVGRGVAPASSTLRTRRLVVPSPLTPTLSRKGRGSRKSLRSKGVTAISTVLGLGVKKALFGDDPFSLPEMERFASLCDGRRDSRCPRMGHWAWWRKRTVDARGLQSDENPNRCPACDRC